MTQVFSPLGALLDAADKQPGGIALQSGDDEWSFEQLAERALRAASVFASHGVERGMRVGLVLHGGETFVTYLLGLLGAGATVVPLNPLYRPDELALHFRANSLHSVVADPGCARLCAETMEQAGLEGATWTVGAADAGRDIEPSVRAAPVGAAVGVAADDVAVVLHTAGSTGRSKLVPRTHGQLAAECDSVARTLETSAEDVIFGMLPLHHCHGLLNCLFAALHAQCRLDLFTDRRPFVLLSGEVMQRLAAARATILPSIPFQIETLSSARGDYDLSALRLCFTGGAALKESAFRRFLDRFGIGVRQQYGCTESGAITLNLDDDLERTWMSAGRPLHGVRVTIEDADDTGEGEICVASPALTTGYEAREGLNSEVFCDGVFRSGDLGRIDENGLVYVTRRRPIYIDVAGHKVDSSEVEDVIASMPGVAEALVVATQSDPAAMTAIIVADRPLQAAEVRSYCRSRLSSYKVPSIFEFRDELPRDELGKQLRKGLM